MLSVIQFTKIEIERNCEKSTKPEYIVIFNTRSCIHRYFLLVYDPTKFIYCRQLVQNALAKIKIIRLVYTTKFTSIL